MKQTRPCLVYEKDCECEFSDNSIRGLGRWRTLISGDRTPTEGLTVGISELPPGEEKGISSHKHPHPEVYFFLSGEGVVLLAGREHKVRTGATLFIPGGLVHAVQNNGTELLRFLYVFPANSLKEVEYEFLVH